MDTTKLAQLRIICREEDIPFFTDEQLQYQLERANGDLNLAAYHCLLIKAEDTTLSVSGLTVRDSSKYFRRLASQYRPTNSGILLGGR